MKKKFPLKARNEKAHNIKRTPLATRTRDNLIILIIPALTSSSLVQLYFFAYIHCHSLPSLSRLPWSAVIHCRVLLLRDAAAYLLLHCIQVNMYYIIQVIYRELQRAYKLQRVSSSIIVCLILHLILPSPVYV